MVEKQRPPRYPSGLGGGRKNSEASYATQESFGASSAGTAQKILHNTTEDVADHMKTLTANATAQISIMQIICQNLDRVETELEQRFQRFERRMNRVEFSVENIVHNLQGGSTATHSEMSTARGEPSRQPTPSGGRSGSALFRKASTRMPTAEDLVDFDASALSGGEEELEQEGSESESESEGESESEDEEDSRSKLGKQDSLDSVPSVVQEVVRRQHSDEGAAALEAAVEEAEAMEAAEEAEAAPEAAAAAEPAPEEEKPAEEEAPARKVSSKKPSPKASPKASARPSLQDDAKEPEAAQEEKPAAAEEEKEAREKRRSKRASSAKRPSSRSSTRPSTGTSGGGGEAAAERKERKARRRSPKPAEAAPGGAAEEAGGDPDKRRKSKERRSREKERRGGPGERGFRPPKEARGKVLRLHSEGGLGGGRAPHRHGHGHGHGGGHRRGSADSAATWSHRFARELARRRWRWAFQQVSALRRLGQTRVSEAKLDPGFSFGARLARLEDAMANVVAELEGAAASVQQAREQALQASQAATSALSRQNSESATEEEGQAPAPAPAEAPSGRFGVFGQGGFQGNQELTEQVERLKARMGELDELRRALEDRGKAQAKEGDFLKAQLARAAGEAKEAQARLAAHAAETAEVKEELVQLHESVGALADTIKQDREKKKEAEEWERRQLAVECTAAMAALIEDLNHVIKLKPVLGRDLEVESLQELAARMGLVLQEAAASDLGLYGAGDLLESACMHAVNVLHRDRMERDDLEPGERAALDTFPGRDGQKGHLVDRVGDALDQMKEVLHHLTNQGTLTLAINEMRAEMSLLVRRAEFDPLQEQIENVLQRMNRKMERGDIEKALEHKLNKTDAQVSMDNLMDAIAELQENVMEQRGGAGAGGPGGGATLSEAEKAQFKKIQKAVREHQETFHKLREELGDKAAAEEVASSLNYVNAQLRRMQNEAVQRETLDLVLRNKVDKKDLTKLAHAISGFGDGQDGEPAVAGSKVRCISCDRPLRGLGKPLSGVVTNPHSFRAPSAAAGAMSQTQPEPIYEATLGPVKTPPGLRASKSAGGLRHSAMSSKGSVRGSTRSGLRTSQASGGRPESPPSEGEGGEGYTGMDGKALSRYNRVMPAPSRVRTSAGGGGHGAAHHSQMKALKDKSNANLLHKIQQMK